MLLPPFSIPGDVERDRVRAYKLYAMLTAALSPMFIVGETALAANNTNGKKVSPQQR